MALVARADFKTENKNHQTWVWWPCGSTYTGVSEGVIVFVDYGDRKGDVIMNLLRLWLHVTGLDLSLQMHKDRKKNTGLFQLGPQSGKKSKKAKW